MCPVWLPAKEELIRSKLLLTRASYPLYSRSKWVTVRKFQTNRLHQRETSRESVWNHTQGWCFAPTSPVPKVLQGGSAQMAFSLLCWCRPVAVRKSSGHDILTVTTRLSHLVGGTAMAYGTWLMTWWIFGSGALVGQQLIFTAILLGCAHVAQTMVGYRADSLIDMGLGLLRSFSKLGSENRWTSEHRWPKLHEIVPLGIWSSWATDHGLNMGWKLVNPTEFVHFLRICKKSQHYFVCSQVLLTISSKCWHVFVSLHRHHTTRYYCTMASVSRRKTSPRECSDPNWGPAGYKLVYNRPK